jgi:SpoVK/Ycf46/Vps4 family AAA+-type ATPase
MEDTLDFSDLTSPISPGLADCHRRRSTCFALRILLGHQEICSSVMEDPETLLRLLGYGAFWQDEVIDAIKSTLKAEGNDDILHVKPTSGTETTGFIARLKSRYAWNTYETTISRLYSQQPHLVIAALEANLARLKPKSLLKSPGNRNTSLLVKLLGLSPVESRLMDYGEARSYALFRRFLNAITGFAPNDTYDFVATAVGAPVHEVRAALRANAPLRTYGLLQLDTSPGDLEDFLRLDTAGKTFLNEDFDSPDDMLRVFLRPGQSPTLSAEDYPHLDHEFTLLIAYLRNVAQQQIKGANVLLYGPPGTGKSEFARLLAQQAGLAYFDVKSSDNEGDPIDGKARLTNFALSQRFLAERERSLVIFDEIEDVFPDTGGGFSAFFGRSRSKTRPDQSKGWINQMLETAPVPGIWISNSVDAIDEAFLRRFDFHLEFQLPPKTVRERIIKRCLGNILVKNELIASLATDDTLSPAQVSRAARFATLCQTSSDTSDEPALLRALKASQAAMGRTLRMDAQTATTGKCNGAYLNLDTDLPLEKIEQALRLKTSATLCFHGVPGAGKTSLAHHLAETIGRPLMTRRASDLLGMYVGESEKRIAQMFRDAEREGAVLLLDEADSFLRSRQQAQRSWEVTQVNELLQQMESFPGVFICTTNLMDDVDEAALRRFTFKVRFDALTPQQRKALFAESVLGNADAVLLPATIQALEKLGAVTPGDFATVRRQERLISERYSSEEFLHRLEHECALKKGSRTAAIGFLR